MVARGMRWQDVRVPTGIALAYLDALADAGCETWQLPREPWPGRPHTCDADCRNGLGEDLVGECRWCGVSHGDPCNSCGGRGFHAPRCTEIE